MSSEERQIYMKDTRIQIGKSGCDWDDLRAKILFLSWLEKALLYICLEVQRSSGETERS